MSDQAIILFAHGARDPEWAAPLGAIQRQLQAARPDVLVVAAFQEFMAPSLEEAVAQAAAQGAQRIVLAPLFLAQGSHLKRDLPLLVAGIRRRHRQLDLQVLPALGDAPEIVQAIAGWISGALGRSDQVRDAIRASSDLGDEQGGRGKG